MFGAEPYQFEPTYPPGEEPALHGEEEERSASPEPVRVGNRDWRILYFYDEPKRVLLLLGAGHSSVYHDPCC